MRHRLAAATVLVIGLAGWSGGSCSPRTAAPDVDGARAHARVVFQVEAGPRIPGTPGHARVRQWIADELERLGATVELQTFTDSTLGRPLELTNVIGRFPPADPARDGRRILLCAHYDTRPVSDRDPDASRRALPLPGANDGGSGVAVLLEVAELLAKQRAPIGVELVFFDGEDQAQSGDPGGYSLGARGYARRLGPDRAIAGFLFDMVGDRDLSIHPEVYSASRAANLVAVVLEGARATGATHFHTEPLHPVMDDHVPLVEAGLPTVDIIDFDYPAWHTQADLPDQVSPESLAEVARVAAWLAYRSPLALGR